MKDFRNIKAVAIYFSIADFTKASDTIVVNNIAYGLSAHDTEKSEQLIYMSKSGNTIEITESDAKITVEHYDFNGNNIEPTAIVDVP